MSFSLQVVAGNKQGLSIPVKKSYFLIGSDRICQLRSHRPGVGHHHCVLVLKDRHLYVQDMVSGQPTLVNGKALQPGAKFRLLPGDRLKVGTLEFVVRNQSKKSAVPVGVPFAAPPPAALTNDPAPAIPFVPPPPPVYQRPRSTVPARSFLAATAWKTGALLMLALVCMGLGWLLFQATLGRSGKNKKEEQVTKADTSEKTPEKKTDDTSKVASAPPADKKPSPPAGKSPSPPAEAPPKTPPAGGSKPTPPPPMGEKPKVALSFARDILPIFEAKCFLCHSGKNKRGGLKLETLANLRKGGDGGPAVVAGDLGKSLLWESIDSDRMPPTKEKLTAAEKKIIRDWIASAKGTPLASGPVPESWTVDRSIDNWRLMIVEGRSKDTYSSFGLHQSSIINHQSIGPRITVHEVKFEVQFQVSGLERRGSHERANAKLAAPVRPRAIVSWQVPLLHPHHRQAGPS